MAQLGDAVVQFPLSGSASGTANIPLAAFMRVVQQASQASTVSLFHPGGTMTGSLQALPRNNNRTRLGVLNSGTLPLYLDHGLYFNPNISPSPATAAADVVIPAGTYYEDARPIYTGPIHLAWSGSGTLSGSAAVVTEYSF